MRNGIGIFAAIFAGLPALCAGSWLDNAKSEFVGIQALPNSKPFAKPDDPIFSIPREKFFPFIDEYGQFKHRDWTNKIHSDADLQAQKAREADFNASLGKIADYDKFGGYKNDSLKAAATGRFTLDKIGGKWTFRDPDGYPFWSWGIDCVGADGAGATALTGREKYFEKIDPAYVSKTWLYDVKKGKHAQAKAVDFSRRNFAKKYGERTFEQKAEFTGNRLRAWGINSAGAWSNEKLALEAQIPFTVFVGSARCEYLAPDNPKLKLDLYWTKFPDYLHPDFKKNTIKSVLGKSELINSPYCIGVFVDNELPWQAKAGLIGRALLSCPASQPSKIEFSKLLEKKYGTISALNSAWKSDYKDWADFLQTRDFDTQTPAAQEDFGAIEKVLTEAYFDACRAAVKAAHPDALYLGCRFGFNWLNPIVVNAAFEKCDAVTFNIYKPSPLEFKKLVPENVADKPILIGEFHFGAADVGNFWCGLQPRETSAERTQAMVKYLEDAAKSPDIVGVHWFNYYDQYTTGRFDGENGAIGFADICDTPKYDMAKASHEFAKKMYRMRFE